MSPAVQKGPLGDLHATGPSPREERVEGTPRRLTQGATARLGDLALLRSILLRMDRPAGTATIFGASNAQNPQLCRLRWRSDGRESPSFEVDA
jgi:hypothetical protein